MNTETIEKSQQPLGLALSFYRPGNLQTRRRIFLSQQPLGLALSFYKPMPMSQPTGRRGVSTAAWACIEFLPLNQHWRS